MLYLKHRLHAGLGHVQPSTDVCWYAERGGGVMLFLAWCRVDHI
jgi:hypothetical protein